MNVTKAPWNPEGYLINASLAAGGAVIAWLRNLFFATEETAQCDELEEQAARELGKIVANVPDYCVEEVAAHTVALILAGLRMLFPLTECLTDLVEHCEILSLHAPVNEKTHDLIDMELLVRANRPEAPGCPGYSSHGLV